MALPRIPDNGRVGRPRSKRVDAAIKRAAMQLAASHGYRAVTLDAIASKSGVAKTSIYRRYQTKADVFLDALLEIGGEIKPPSAQLCALDRIVSHAADVGRAFRSGTGDILRGLLADAQFDPDFLYRFQLFINKRRAMLLMLIEDGMRSAEIVPSANPALLCDLIFGTLWYRMLVAVPASDAYIRDAVRLTMSHVLVPAQRKNVRARTNVRHTKSGPDAGT